MNPNHHRFLLATWVAIGSWLVYGLVALADARSTAALAPASDLPFEKLTVLVSTKGKPGKCARTQGLGTLRCSNDVWHFVGPYVDRANGEPFRCLWVHPPKDGERLELLYEGVELAGEISATLALMPGSGGGATVRAKIAVDGDALGTVSTDHERDVARWHSSVPPSAAPRQVRVSIEAENNRWRLACLQLRGAANRPVLAHKGKQ